MSLLDFADFIASSSRARASFVLTRTQQRTVNIEIKAILCLIGQKRLHIPDGLHPALAHCGQGGRLMSRI